MKKIVLLLVLISGIWVYSSAQNATALNTPAKAGIALNSSQTAAQLVEADTTVKSKKKSAKGCCSKKAKKAVKASCDHHKSSSSSCCHKSSSAKKD